MDESFSEIINVVKELWHLIPVRPRLQKFRRGLRKIFSGTINPMLQPIDNFQLYIQPHLLRIKYKTQIALMLEIYGNFKQKSE